MLVHRSDNSASPLSRSHSIPGHVPHGYAQPTFIFTERPNVLAARISRKRSVADAILVTHGTLKRAYLAGVLGVSESYVKRCLSDAHRDEFSEAHCLKLGIGRVQEAA